MGKVLLHVTLTELMLFRPSGYYRYSRDVHGCQLGDDDSSRTAELMARQRILQDFEQEIYAMEDKQSQDRLNTQMARLANTGHRVVDDRKFPMRFSNPQDTLR